MSQCQCQLFQGQLQPGSHPRPRPAHGMLTDQHHRWPLRRSSTIGATGTAIGFPRSRGGHQSQRHRAGQHSCRRAVTPTRPPVAGVLRPPRRSSPSCRCAGAAFLTRWPGSLARDAVAPRCIAVLPTSTPSHEPAFALSLMVAASRPCSASRGRPRPQRHRPVADQRPAARHGLPRRRLPKPGPASATFGPAESANEPRPDPGSVSGRGSFSCPSPRRPGRVWPGHAGAPEEPGRPAL